MRLALEGEGELGALVRQSPSDGPGDGTLVGHPEDEPLLACERLAHGRRESNAA